MSRAFSNGVPNLQASDKTRNQARKTIFNNLRGEIVSPWGVPMPASALRYQPIRVCHNGCVVSNPSYQSKMDLNFGWLLCNTPWCSYSMLNPTNAATTDKFLELDVASVEQIVVDSDVTPATVDPRLGYQSYPNGSQIVMDDLHIDPDGKLFSGQQIITNPDAEQDIRYCSNTSDQWKEYISARFQYTTESPPVNPYQVVAAQNTTRVPTNVVYGTRYSILSKNGNMSANNPVQPCLCNTQCKNGILGHHHQLQQFICCASSCGACGGAGCSGHPGGAALCCTGNILASGVVCATDSDVGCIVDTNQSCK